MIVEYYGQFRIADMYSLLLFIFILASLANWAMKSLFGFLSPVSRKRWRRGDVFLTARFEVNWKRGFHHGDHARRTRRFWMIQIPNFVIFVSFVV